MKKIIIIIITILFCVNSISFALAPPNTSGPGMGDSQVDSGTSGTKDAMHAMGRRKYLAKIGPGKEETSRAFKFKDISTLDTGKFRFKSDIHIY